MSDDNKITMDRLKRYFKEQHEIEKWIGPRAEAKAKEVLQSTNRRWKFTGRFFAAEGDTIMCEVKCVFHGTEWVAIPMPDEDGE